MNLNASLDISASGMQAQSARLRIIAENLANADSTPLSPGEEPYRRQIISFKNMLDKSSGANMVAVNTVTKDQSDFNSRFEPGHPAADANGYVKTPNVDRFIETMDMREAQRTYEANLNMLELSKSMILQTVNTLRT